MTELIKNDPTDSAAENDASVIQEIEANLRNQEEKKHLESELHLTLEEIARLQNALAETEMKLVSYQKQLLAAFPPRHEEGSFTPEILSDLSKSLTTIQNYCELIDHSSAGTMSDIQKAYLARISRTSQRLNEIAQHIHKDTLPDLHEPEQASAQVNIASLINQVLAPKLRLMEQKQITLQMVISDRIPEFNANVAILTRIIDILISNALTVTPMDSIVKIVANSINIYKERMLQITVKDGGPGMTLKDLDIVLSDNTPTDQILPGLSIPRSHVVLLNQLIVDQKGSLEIRNGLDYGTIFEIHLPLEQS